MISTVGSNSDFELSDASLCSIHACTNACINCPGRIIRCDGMVYTTQELYLLRFKSVNEPGGGGTLKLPLDLHIQMRMFKLPFRHRYFNN